MLRCSWQTPPGRFLAIWLYNWDRVSSLPSGSHSLSLALVTLQVALSRSPCPRKEWVLFEVSFFLSVSAPGSSHTMLGLNSQPHSRPFQGEARSIDLKLWHGKTEFTKVLFLRSDISTPVHKCVLWLGGGHLGTEGDPRWVPITTLSAGTK